MAEVPGFFQKALDPMTNHPYLCTLQPLSPPADLFPKEVSEAENGGETLQTTREAGIKGHLHRKRAG